MIGFKRKFLSKSNEPYYISEIGINHNGKLKIALELIKQSKDIGCSAVKFQKRDTNDLLELGLWNKDMKDKIMIAKALFIISILRTFKSDILANLGSKTIAK